MRSNWSLERGLGLFAAATLEAAWLTLAYVLIQWLTGERDLFLGIIAFGLAAAFGLVLARAARNWPRPRYAAVLVGSSVAVAVIGTFAIGVPQSLPDARSIAFQAHAGGFLLGLAVWRGTLHAEVGDEAELSEGILRAGVPGLVAFWVIATWMGMIGSVAYTAPAFVATLAFIGAGLLSLGLARLTELEVEQMDRGARRRWVTLLLAISGLVLLLAVPLATVLGVPVARSIEAMAGPLAPILVQLALLLLIPAALIAELVSGLLRTLIFPSSPGPQASMEPLPTSAPGQGPDIGSYAVDLSWLGIVALAAVVVIALMIAAALARPPGTLRRARGVDEEREAEPMDIKLPIHLPKLRMPRLRGSEPRTAVDAYRFALVALSTTPDGRQPIETPREHAGRVGSANAADLRRLAADYQLAAFARADLSAQEERRAIARWRRVVGRVRRTRRVRAATPD